eukprot:768147-Hanusia_phi.AAC.4
MNSAADPTSNVHIHKHAIITAMVHIHRLPVDECVVVSERGPVLLLDPWRIPREGEPVAALPRLCATARTPEADAPVALLPQLVPTGPAHDGIWCPVRPAAVQVILADVIHLCLPSTGRVHCVC